MSTVALVVSIIGGLVVIAGFVVAVSVTSQAKGQEETIGRLRADRDDYRDRLEFVEPRLAKALEENALLQELHNPTQAMADLKADTAKIRSDTGTIMALLRAQAADLVEMQQHVHVERGDQERGEA